MEISQDREIQVIQKETEPVGEKIRTLIISDENSQKLASVYLGLLAKSLRRLEERRKFFTKDIYEAKKKIDTEFKSLAEPLEELQEVLKSKLLEYNTVLRQRESEKQKEIEQFAKDSGLPPVETPSVPAPLPAVRTAIGTSYVTRRWTWRVTDETKIPREYLIVDEKKINALLKGSVKTVKGVQTMELVIDGIEFYQEEGIGVRT